MQLDISNSNFETVIDDIASGLDPSASSYIVSSSYSNGNLVRSGGPDTNIATGNGTGGSSTSTSNVTTQQATTSTQTSTSGSSSSGSISY